jgi:outer membrane immunogenic protein
MKQLSVGATAFLAMFSCSAVAADLSAPAYKAPPAAAPLYDWTGFFIGAHASYGWSRSDTDMIDAATGTVLVSTSSHGSRAHGGGQIGYDYMMPSRLVLGIVADADSGSSGDGYARNLAGTNVVTFHSTTDVSGTVRVRVGYAFDTLLLYGTGGWAWATGSGSRTQVVGTFNLATPGTVETVHRSANGWTLGAGLAWAFAGNWNVYGQYRFTDHGTTTVTYPLAQWTNSTSHQTENRVELGVNYKF